MFKLTAAASLLSLAIPAMVLAQTPVAVVNDVIYSRPDGGAVLADIAYPVGGSDLSAIVYVHGGRWRAGARDYRQSLNVAQWAGMGFFAMTIDYRLVGATPAPAAYQADDDRSVPIQQV